MAEDLVDSAAIDFRSWLAERSVAPMVAALVAQAEQVRCAELTRALARLSHLSERDRQTIEALSSAIVNKLLHAPIAALKQAASTDRATGPALATADISQLAA